MDLSSGRAERDGWKLDLRLHPVIRPNTDPCRSACLPVMSLALLAHWLTGLLSTDYLRVRVPLPVPFLYLHETAAIGARSHGSQPWQPPHLQPARQEYLIALEVTYPKKVLDPTGELLYFSSMEGTIHPWDPPPPPPPLSAHPLPHPRPPSASSLIHPTHDGATKARPRWIHPQLLWSVQPPSALVPPPALL